MMKSWATPPLWLTITFCAAHLVAAFVIWRDVIRSRSNRWTWFVAFACASIFMGFGLYLFPLLMPLALFLYWRDRNDLQAWDDEVLAILSLAFQGTWVLTVLDGAGILVRIGHLLGIKGAA